MVEIKTGKWQPDLWNVNSGVAMDVQGCLPGANSKRPWPSLEPYTSAMADVCRGAILVKDASGTNQIFAGTSTKLYKLNSSTLAWTDVTRSAGGNYAVPSGARWSFDVFGANLYAAQIGDAMQSINMSSGTNFAPVSGSPPQCRYIKTIGDQLWAMSDNSASNRATWCGRNNPTFWSTGGGQDCDYQDFPDGGFVRGAAGIVNGFIFQDTVVRAFAPTTSREIYTFQKVDDSSGILAHDSLVSFLDTYYYLAPDGFRSVGPQGLQKIGLGYVDEWFAETCSADATQRALTTGVLDPSHPRIFWAFTSLSSGYTLDHVVCYDIAFKEWTHAMVSTEVLLQAGTAGYTMEQLGSLYSNLDTLGISLDSRTWAGGQPVISGIDSDHKLGFFTGSNMAAIIDSMEVQLISGKRALVRGCRPMTDSSSVSVAVGTRQTQISTEGIDYRASQSRNGRGWVPARASGRYHTFRATIDAGEVWTHFSGFDPEHRVHKQGNR